MYDRASGTLLLRLRFRTVAKQDYLPHRETLASPTADQVWSVFEDSTATNVEIRKLQARSASVEVDRYHTASPGHDSALDVPRDSLGRLWGRLEENPVSSVMFHWLVRRFGDHVELFLTRDEFRVFWDAHQRLLLSKIQLRFVRRDGLPHSPCRDDDCIAADLFMRRRNSGAFLEFVRQQLPNARFNCGKHSL
jgi:hypothetical protein